MSSKFRRCKTAVATHQAHLHTCHRLIEGLAHELHAVGARRRVAWAQPGIGHHACLTDEGHERMVRVAPFAVGVVAFGRAFLTAIAFDDRAVEVHRHRAHLDLREESPLQGRDHRSVACLRELAEEPAVGSLARQAVVIEDGGERLILAQPIAVNVAAGSRPNAEPEAFDDMEAAKK